MKTRTLIKNLLYACPVFSWYMERRAYKKEVDAACRWILNDVLQRARGAWEKEHPTCATWEDYLEAYHKYLIEYSEYFHQYEFWKLEESERAEYLMRTRMRLFYLHTLSKRVRYLFWDKEVFLRAYPEYVHRRWLVARKATYEEFADLVNNVDCMAKPLAQACGIGVFKIYKGQNNVEKLYAECKDKNLLLEECISGCRELQQFHPQSLNSIRLVTINNAKAGEVFAAFLRMGRGGNTIDNAHAGGIFATIDVESGRVITDAFNTEGERFAAHPDTKLPIKGFLIPEWERIKHECVQAAIKYRDVFIVGWDVVLDTRGNVVFVEGNQGPDVDLLQSPLKKGIKQELQAVLCKYHGDKYILP